jgi:hypothetical protein
MGLSGCDLYFQVFGKVTADAGQDQTVTVGTLVTLDGTKSRDSKGGTSLQYSWAFQSVPAGSSQNLPIATADQALARFSPDSPGMYALRLTVSEGRLSASATVNVTANDVPPPPGAPPAPAWLSVGSPTLTSLAVSWSAVSGATSYQAYRGRSASGPFSTLAYDGPATSFADTGLASGGTYYYKVRATNAAGSGLFSTVASWSVLLSNIMPIPGTGTFTYSVDLGSSPRSVFFVFSNPAAISSSAPRVNGVSVQSEIAPVLDAAPGARAMGFGLKDRPDPTGFNTNPFRYLSPVRSRTLIVAQPHPALDAVGDPLSFKDTRPTDLIPSVCRKVVADTGVGGTGKTLNIWVANDCWYQGGTKAYLVTPAMVDVIANAFLNPAAAGSDLFGWVTNIYGEEYGPHHLSNMIAPDGQITILLYDIDGDNRTDGGVIGYFWSKDEFLASLVANSNQRVMFYLDAVLLATPDTPPNWHANDYWPSEIVSALAHELQHLIHFYQKNVSLAGGAPTSTVTWIDEMASMVTEDLVADKLHNPGPRGVLDDPTAGGPNNGDGRLPRYIYSDSASLSDWGNPDLKTSYAVAYAFGAYLARNFGGAPLFRDLVLDARTDSSALDDALGKSVAGSSETFASVFWKWGVANLLSDSTSAPAGFAYNRGGFYTSAVGGTSYNLGSINLYNYTYKGQIGPALSTVPSAGAGSQQMTSNILFRAGSALSGLHSWQIQLPSSVSLTVVLK